MLEKLTIKGTRETPEIVLDKELGILKIEGRSLPENAFEFYTPTVNWLKEYNESPNKETNLNIYLEYLNSGSLKQLFRIIYLMEDLIEDGNESHITWRFKKNDELMREKGLEFKQLLEIPIVLEEI